MNAPDHFRFPAYRVEPYVWDGLEGRAIAPLPRRAHTRAQSAIDFASRIAAAGGFIVLAFMAITYLQGGIH